MLTEPSQDTGGMERSPEGEVILQAGSVLQMLRRWFWIVLLVIGACAGTALGLSLQQTPMYQASIKVLVGQAQGIAEDPTQASNLQLLTVTLGEAVATYPVAQSVVEDLNLEMSPSDLIANTNVEVIPQTQFIEISYTDSDPQRAQRIANGIGDAFSKQVAGVSPNVSGITATVWEPAVVPRSPISPNPVRNVLIAVVLGSILGVGLAFLLEYRDNSWRSPEEVERISGIPTIGVIPQFVTPRGRKN